MNREQGSILLSLMILFLLCALYLSSGVAVIGLKIFHLQQWRASLDERERYNSLFLKMRADKQWDKEGMAVLDKECQLFNKEELRRSQGFVVKRIATDCFPESERAIYRLSLDGKISGYKRVLYQYQFMPRDISPVLTLEFDHFRSNDRWLFKVDYQGREFDFQLTDKNLIENNIDLEDRTLDDFTLIPVTGDAASRLDLLFVMQGGRYLWKLESGNVKLFYQFLDRELVLASLLNREEGRLYLFMVNNGRTSLSDSLGLYLFNLEKGSYIYQELQDDLLLSHEGVAEKGNFKIEKINSHFLILKGEMWQRYLGSQREEFLLAMSWSGDALWRRQYFWGRSTEKCGFQQEVYEPIAGWQIGCQRQTPTKLLYLY